MLPFDCKVDHRELRHAGNNAMNQKDYERAAELFSQSIDAKPDDFNGYFHRATAYVELRRSDEALADFDKCLQLKSNYLSARVKRAQLLIELDRLDEAATDLDTVLAKKPTHSLANIIKKRLAKSRSATAAAEVLKDVDNQPCAELVPKLSSAIAGLPHDSLAAEPLRLRRAECALLAADHAAILDDTRRVLALNANNVRALELRGHALLALGEDEAAQQHFNKCSRRDPDNDACRWHFKRARALQRALAAARAAQQANQWQQLRDAVEEAATAANDAPDEATRDARAAALAALSEERRAALGALGSGGGGVHRNELLRMRCSALAYVASLEEAALLACQVAADENGGDAEPLVQRADVLLRLERFDEAIGDYTRALQRDNRNRRAAQGKHNAEHKRKLALRKDYYKILDVPRNADFKTIKRAYRKLAALYHPDKAADGEKESAEAMYFELGEAYEILTDDEKKAQYDQGADYEDIMKAQQHANSQQHNPFGGQQFRGFRWG